MNALDQTVRFRFIDNRALFAGRVPDRFAIAAETHGQTGQNKGWADQPRSWVNSWRVHKVWRVSQQVVVWVPDRTGSVASRSSQGRLGQAEQQAV